MENTIGQNQLTNRYDSVAKKWRCKIARLGYPAAYQTLIEQCFSPANAGVDVLDAGAGSGAFSIALANFGPQIHTLSLLDISSEMLSAAREGIGQVDFPITCQQGGIERLQGEGLYDVVLCAHVIEHCEDAVAALRKLHRGLRPKGVLLLVASKPHWCTALIRMIWGNKAYTPKKMQDLLKKAGFRDPQLHAFSSGPPSRTSMGYIAHKQEIKNADRDC